jgi:hypothetical protein
VIKLEREVFRTRKKEDKKEESVSEALINCDFIHKGKF